MSKIKLFTHTDLDGIGCAILAYLAFGRENVDVEYCGYDDVDGKVRAHYLHNEIHYDHMYITDISVGEEVAQGIDTWVAKDHVQLFDHHTTALYLNEYVWCDVRVAMETGIKTSGTELFWNYLYHCDYFDELSKESFINLVNFVKIVRDYDTWRWKELGEEGIVCKQVNDLFHIYGREEFINWMSNRIKYPKVFPYFPAFDDQDIALLRQKQKDIDRYIEKKDQQLQGPFKDPFGYTYGVVFAEQYFSELGNRLCELHPWLDYVAMIDISNGAVSYRAIKEDIDLGGEIAHSFGGGGHRKAAGSRFDGEYMRELVMHAIFPNPGHFTTSEMTCDGVSVR